jgi:hypothetical protein
MATAALLAIAGCGSTGATSTTAATGNASTASATASSLFAPVRDIACATDARVIQTAQDAHALLHGRFATLPELVEAGLLRRPSGSFREVQVGTPPGGYTLVGAAGHCGDLPVAGPG